MTLCIIPNYDRWATSAPDEFDYPERCEGTKHRKCGRFLAWGQSACDRCKAEIDADWNEMIAKESEQERRYNAELLAAEDAYTREDDGWYSESYVDAMGEEAAAQSEYFEGYGDDLDF